MNIDRERLLEENLNLKNQLNKMQSEHLKNATYNKFKKKI